MTDSNKKWSSAEHFKFKSFHELMTRRIGEILLVSSVYDAYIMQEDGPLAERIIHEYRGLNLSRPPRLTWISNGSDALEEIRGGNYDMVVVMPHIGDMHSYDLCAEIKELKDDLPVYYFAYDAGQIMEDRKYFDQSPIDRTLLWSGSTDLLMAIVKNREDQINVELDTELAEIRVIIFVEDSPFYLSSILPVLYREVVLQTQEVMDDSLNEKDRLLRMRTRPKILVAENYEQAWGLYQKFKKYLFCIISDVRFDKDGKEDPIAGIKLLTEIKKEQDDLPMLVLSSEHENRQRAEELSALFSDKNSPRLHKDIINFFTHSLGFGEFLFNMGDGTIVASARNLRAMVNVLRTVPNESLSYHARRNDFSRWLMARFEMEIAQIIRSVMLEDFDDVDGARDFLITVIRNKLKKRQIGHITDFIKEEFDPDNDFVRIGKGSLGGKARGLAFVSSLLYEEGDFDKHFESVTISLPKTMVITTDGFDQFARQNDIYKKFSGLEEDSEIEAIFHDTTFPKTLRNDLAVFLQHIHHPLAIRSSAILEDAHYRASAGAYRTYMLPNNSPDFDTRLEQLVEAVKLVYSSVFLETPRILAKNSIYRQEDDKMAVIIQQLVGKEYNGFFYPALSGVAQSYNFYPVSYMKPAEGVAHIALGLGKIVVDGGIALRFSPKYPQLLPQFSSIDDILQNCQRYFYGLQMDKEDTLNLEGLLEKIDLDRATDHFPVRKLASTFDHQDGRLRDYFTGEGHPIITFASILKYNEIPLGEILSEILEIGEKGMGCPVEIEFAVNLDAKKKPHFYLLQIRPMIVAQNRVAIDINPQEIESGWCFSDMTMGQSQEKEIHSIIFVKPDDFDTAKTKEIAQEVNQLNAHLKDLGKKYVLIGPGRWGSSDRWLGIPIQWSGITEAHTIIETTSEKLHAEPSQGSHFFHNITSLGINYLVVPQKGKSFIQHDWLNGQTVSRETTYLKYIELEKPSILKINGKLSEGLILKNYRSD